MIWTGSDGASDPVWRFEFVAPGFEGAAPSEIVGQVLGGDLGSATLPILDRRVEHGFDALGERGRLALRTSFWVAGDAGVKAPARGCLR